MNIINARISCFSFLYIVFFDCSHGWICEHFTNLANEGDDHACNSTQIDENGICNITVNCVEGFTHKHDHCFTSWTNISGVVTVVKQGCWIKSDSCHGRCISSTLCGAGLGDSTYLVNSLRKICLKHVWVKTCHKTDKFECVTLKRIFRSSCVYSGKETDVMFCCCNGDLCNAQFSANISVKPLDFTDQPIEVTTVDDASAKAAYAVAIFIVAIAALLAGVYCYQKRKKKLDQLDALSVETPASGLTTATATTNLLPNVMPEVNLPQLIEMKARGRFGCVWKAQLQDRYVAVKSFYLQDKQSWQNEQEIFNTPLVNSHPNVLRFIAAASRGMGVEIEFWLITEFHEYGSLADYLKTRAISISDALCFMECMATGLAFLHEDVLCNSKTGNDGYKPAIAHRDFKSKNVLITHKRTAVIADFGLAIKFVPGESPGETHGQVGTRRYMAPEILEGAINFHRDAFLRIDMYAFALVLWEVLSRCFDAPGGAAPTYLMPYEEELSQHPTIEEMQENVVEKKLRPRIMHEWRQHSILGLICETIEECWDHDVEARLSAGCVEERLRNLQKKIISPPLDLPIQSNCLNCAPTNVEIQNQLNAQKNGMNFHGTNRLICGGPAVVDPAYVALPPESPRRSRNMESNV